MAQPLGILVVDDFAPFRQAIREILANGSNLMVVGEAIDGRAAIELALHLVPQVVVMNVKLPGVSGVEAARRIKRVLPDIHIIGICSQDDMFTKKAMQAAGASGFITKECADTLPQLVAHITSSPMGNNTVL
jgi:DNA-binding NarL/FixJ family response regulator